jgi:hypothetical protein
VSDHSNLGFSGFGRGNENSHDLGHSRGRGRGVGFVRRAKGEKIVHKEERQLTRSIMVISQDPICEYQQNDNAF